MSEPAVVAHYAHDGLANRFFDALAMLGSGILDPDQLASVDEFHIGGRMATAELADQLHLRPGLRVLDIGSGLGGTARFLAGKHAVEVTGLDLTPHYVQLASWLTCRVGLAQLVRFCQGSATNLPFPDDSFDRVCMLHVGMNIADKTALFGEIRRVLLSGGVFGLYDVMRIGPGEVRYPVPWATISATSFLAEPQRYRELLMEAGLPVQAECDRGSFAINSIRQRRVRAAQDSPSPLGPHLVMGPDAALKIANVADSLERGVLAPIEMICFAQ